MATWKDRTGTERFHFDFQDLIRMDRNAQTMNLADFENWYKELALHLRPDYIEMLFRYGSEYNDGTQWHEVLQLAGIDPEDALYRSLADFPTRYGQIGTGGWASGNSRRIADLARNSSEFEQRRLAQLAAAYFCVNEKERFEICKKTGIECRHWWHADLTDPKIVSQLCARRG